MYSAKKTPASVKKRLLKVAVGIEDCFKMLDEGDKNKTRNVSEEKLSESLEDISGKIKNLDLMTAPGDLANNRYVQKVVPKTFDVGVQVDLCGCSFEDVNTNGRQRDKHGGGSREYRDRKCSNGNLWVTEIFESNSSSTEFNLSSSNFSRGSASNEFEEVTPRFKKDVKKKCTPLRLNEMKSFDCVEGILRGTPVNVAGMQEDEECPADDSLLEIDTCDSLDDSLDFYDDPVVHAGDLNSQLRREVDETTKKGNGLRSFIINSTSDSTASGTDKSSADRFTGKYTSSATHHSFLGSLSPDIQEHLIHPDAKRFLSKFSSTKEELAKVLYDMFNERVFSGKLKLTTELAWNDKLTKTAGYCRHFRNKENKERYFKIELSPKVCDTPDRLRDTLIHEMCHAYEWVVYGSSGHGAYWQLWARRANIILEDLPPIRTCHSYVIKTKYTYECVQCGYKFGRHSKQRNLESKVCRRCKGSFKLVHK